MTTPVTTNEKTPQLPTGAWSVALRGKLTQEAIAKMPPGISEDQKLAVMEQLVKKLRFARDYDLMDPRQMASVVPKRNYGGVETIEVGSVVRALQVLPDGRIVVGGGDGVIRIYAKYPDGQWNCEKFRAHRCPVSYLQALPDGRIVSGSSDKPILFWTKDDDGRWRPKVLRGENVDDSCLQALPDGRLVVGGGKVVQVWHKELNGRWSSEALSEHTHYLSCLQVLPDGRIVLGVQDGTIRIWTRGADGKWSSEDFGRQRLWPSRLQALPDGRIVSGYVDGTIRIWTKGADGTWGSEVLEGHDKHVFCLQALPDGRLVSCSRDETIRIWTKTADVQIVSRLRSLFSSQPVAKWDSEVLSGHTGIVYCLQVLPDGRIFSGAQDGTIRIWNGDEIAGGQS